MNMNMNLYILWRHDAYKGTIEHRIVRTDTDLRDLIEFKRDVELDNEAEDTGLTYSIETVNIHPEHCPVCMSHNWDYGHYEHMLTCCDCGKIFSKG